MDEGPEPFEFQEPMPCYEFNGTLSAGLDDGRCVHCQRYLTLDCPYIGHFLGDDEE